MQHDKAALCATLKADGIGVCKGGGNDLLLVCKTVYRPNAVTQLGGPLKAQLLGCFGHAVVEVV